MALLWLVRDDKMIKMNKNHTKMFLFVSLFTNLGALFFIGS